MALNLPAKTILIFGVYFLIEGVSIILFGGLFADRLGIPAAAEPMFRVSGLIFVVLGYYYIRAAHAGMTPFFHWTVQMRIAQFGFFLVVVLGLDWFDWPMLIASGIELAGGLWTWWALRVRL
jgi:hypothetical protein